jgi:hypothetical protein
MKTKKELLRELGMIEARRLGLADKWDQLLLATSNMVGELRSTGHLRMKSDDSLKLSALEYLTATLEEFKGDL